MLSHATKLTILAATLLMGCSAASDDGTESVSSADSTSGAQPFATIRTESGGEASVDFVVDPPTGAGFASPSLIISYQDKKAFFGHGAAIDADLVIHKSDGAEVKGRVAVVNGIAVFTVGDTLIASIDLVFSHAGKRDPAGSKAYHVSFDHPDTRCAVVLRNVDAPSFGAPPFVWKGTIDVDTRKLEGSSVGIEWRSSFIGIPHATELVTKRVSGAPAGFQRFEFQIAHDAFPSNGVDATSLRMFQLSLIPFVNLPDGTRIFDHNRVPDLQSYVLWAGDTAGGLVPAPPNATIGAGYAVANDAAICKHPR